MPNPEHRDALKKVFDMLHMGNTNPFSITAFEAAYRGGETWLDSLLVYLRNCGIFVQQAGVGMNPSTVFGKEGSGFMRLNIAAPRRIIAEALEQVVRAFSR